MIAKFKKDINNTHIKLNVLLSRSILSIIFVQILTPFTMAYTGMLMSVKESVM